MVKNNEKLSIDETLRIIIETIDEFGKAMVPGILLAILAITSKILMPSIDTTQIRGFSVFFLTIGFANRLINTFKEDKKRSEVK
jgi:hypothetical protein